MHPSTSEPADPRPAPPAGSTPSRLAVRRQQTPTPNPQPPLLTTEEVAHRLGVKAATVYAYVSRGLLGRERAPDGRTSTFDPAEIDRLARPGRARRGRRPATDLVVPSALTAIDHGLPWYRGLAVTDLAGSRTFEEVAEWLWTGHLPAGGAAQ